jgi:hypothetical protein
MAVKRTQQLMLVVNASIRVTRHAHQHTVQVSQLEVTEAPHVPWPHIS